MITVLIYCLGDGHIKWTIIPDVFVCFCLDRLVQEENVINIYTENSAVHT